MGDNVSMRCSALQRGRPDMKRSSRLSEFGGYEREPFIAELYDHTIHYASRADVDFHLEFARAAGGGILELGCGTGRILVPIAAAGCRIVGLDLSDYMLAKCREKLLAQPADVRERARLVKGNMVSFSIEETFSLVTFPFRSFHHLLSVSDQLSCLGCANRHLEAGGKLVLDLFNFKPDEMLHPNQKEETEDFRDLELPDGRKFRRTQRIAGFNRAEQYLNIELIHYVTHADGRTERLVQAFPWRYFFRSEAQRLLERSGFKILDIFGDYDRSNLSDKSPEMIFVAEKCREVEDSA